MPNLGTQAFCNASTGTGFLSQKQAGHEKWVTDISYPLSLPSARPGSLLESNTQQDRNSQGKAQKWIEINVNGTLDPCDMYSKEGTHQEEVNLSLAENMNKKGIFQTHGPGNMWKFSPLPHTMGPPNVISLSQTSLPIQIILIKPD